MPKALRYLLVVLVIGAMVPPALIARKRAVPTDKPRLHLVLDMDNQHKFRAQHPTDIFLDLRAMRPPVEGAVPWGPSAFNPSEEMTRGDSHFHDGYVTDESGQPMWAQTYPQQIELSMDTLQHGRERFNIFCQPCHGMGGYGDGIINDRAMQLMETPARNNGTAWVPTKSLHEDLIREQPPGQLYNTITHGIRTMPAYGPQIPVRDRWAIVAYVKALQRSQDVSPDEIPGAQMRDLTIVEFPIAAPAADESGDMEEQQ